MRKSIKNLIRYLIVFVVGILLLFLLFGYMMSGECSSRIYRPEITGVVCDVNTKQPIAKAAIVFIIDTLALDVTFGEPNMNLNESYVTDKKGVFKIKRIKDKNMRYSPYTTSYSTIFTVSHGSYSSDTISIREVPIYLSEYVLDTIWLKKR